MGVNGIDVAKAAAAGLSLGVFLSRLERMLRPTEPSLYALLLLLVTLVSTVSGGKATSYSAGKEIILSVLVFLALLNWELSHKQWTFLIICLGTGCSIAIAKGWFGLEEAPWTQSDKVQRASLEAINTNHVAYACVACLSLIIAFWATPRVAKSDRELYYSLIVFGAVGILILGLVITASRGAIVGLAGVVCVLFARAAAKKQFGNLIFAGAATGLTTVAITTSSTVMARFENVGENYIRLDLWPAAWNLFIEKPILGIGVGQFPALSGFEIYPHNGFLSILVELGLVGFLVYAMLVWSVLKRSFRGSLKWIPLIVMSGLLPVIMTGVWERNTIFFVCLAFVASVSSLGQWEPNLGLKFKAPRAMGCGAGVCGPMRTEVSGVVTGVRRVH